MLLQENREYIVSQFEIISSKEDFVNLLNYAKKLIIGESFKPFEVKQVTYYANPKASGNRYKQFNIQKKSGGIRIIHAPVSNLKIIQQCLNLILQCVFSPHSAATGFVSGKSIVDNANAHTHKNYVYNIDLKDFFPSIDQAQVWKCLQLYPFNLVDKDIEFDKDRLQSIQTLSKSVFLQMAKIIGKNQEINIAKWQQILNTYLNDKKKPENFNQLIQLKTTFAKIAFQHKQQNAIKTISKWWNSFPLDRRHIAEIIASLCCTEILVNRFINGKWESIKTNVLPQGAPTSPIISNIVCQKLDFLLTGVAKRFTLKYTRYADDITFSSQRNIYKDGGDFQLELKRIVIEQGFHINESKVRLQQKFYKQEVTGLVVNETVNVNKTYTKQLRMWLYYWEQYGYERAYTYFFKSYILIKKNKVKGTPNMSNIILGKLDFLKMVKGEENSTYLKLRERYNRLTIINKPTEIINESIEKTKITDATILSNKHQPVQNNIIENNIKKHHNPLQVIKWLKLFSDNDSAIKFSTHVWDEDLFPDYFSFTQGLNDEYYNNKIFELQNFNSNLYWEKIYPFLFQKELTNLQKAGKSSYGWGKYEIKLGWQYPEVVKQWCEKYFDNKDKDASSPYSMEIPEEYLPGKLIGGKTMKYFEDYINLFKDEIEFRDNRLFIGVKTICKQELSNHIIDDNVLETLKGCSFFTNTEYVLKAITIIFRMIRSRPHSKNVKISCFINEQLTDYSLEILHIDSYADIDISHPKITAQKNFGELTILRKILTSLCDFAIESRFKDNKMNVFSSRIEYLYDGVEKNNWSPKITTIDLPANGFKFILKFPIT